MDCVKVQPSKNFPTPEKLSLCFGDLCGARNCDGRIQQNCFCFFQRETIIDDSVEDEVCCYADSSRTHIRRSREAVLLMIQCQELFGMIRSKLFLPQKKCGLHFRKIRTQCACKATREFMFLFINLLMNCLEIVMLRFMARRFNMNNTMRLTMTLMRKFLTMDRKYNIFVILLSLNKSVAGTNC